MILRNVSKNTLIAKDLKIAASFLDNALGLIKKTNPRSMLFKTHFGIHTFLLKEPIDVIVLDKNLKVVKLKENLKPNRLFFWNPKYYLVIELPLGSIDKYNINLYDQLSLC